MQICVSHLSFCVGKRMCCKVFQQKFDFILPRRKGCTWWPPCPDAPMFANPYVAHFRMKSLAQKRQNPNINCCWVKPCSVERNSHHPTTQPGRAMCLHTGSCSLLASENWRSTAFSFSSKRWRVVESWWVKDRVYSETPRWQQGVPSYEAPANTPLSSNQWKVGRLLQCQQHREGHKNRTNKK